MFGGLMCRMAAASHWLAQGLTDAVRRYAAGCVAEGTVVSRHRFGFFVDLDGPVLGLIEVPMIVDVLTHSCHQMTTRRSAPAYAPCFLLVDSGEVLSAMVSFASR